MTAPRPGDGGDITHWPNSFTEKNLYKALILHSWSTRALVDDAVKRGFVADYGAFDSFDFKEFNTMLKIK